MHPKIMVSTSFLDVEAERSLSGVRGIFAKGLQFPRFVQGGLVYRILVNSKAIELSLKRRKINILGGYSRWNRHLV